MRNPLRTEAEAFRFLIVVIVGAAIIVACAYLNEWLGVAAAVLVIGGILWWLWHAPTTVPPPPPPRRRILLVVAPNASSSGMVEALRPRVDGREVEVLVLVPALSPPPASVAGAADELGEDAQRTADALASELRAAGLDARGAVGADEPVLAAEDALREFGADEVVLAGDEQLLASARERLAVPVSLLG
jgi:hypothetical protein